MDWLRGEGASREFEAFVNGATGELFQTAYLLTLDERLAEDLVQEASVRLASHWGRMRSMEHPLAYARRVLVNASIDSARKRGRGRDLFADEDVQGLGGPAGTEASCGG